MFRAFRMPLLAFLLFAFFFSFAGAIAAPEGGEDAAPPGQDNKSYLPPWMQKQEGTGAKTGTTEVNSTMAADVTDPANPDTKPKTPKPQQRRRNNAFYWPGFGFFGR